MKILPPLTKRLLSKEAALSSMNLGVGLTFLGKSNFAELGYIYQSFFSLSVGLERLMKLILLYEYIYRHENYPDKDYFRKWGHDLFKLYEEVKKMAMNHSSERFFEKVDNDQICILILKNLSDFSKKNRYFHFDSLTGIETSSDPLKKWEEEINVLLLKRHYRVTKSDLLTMRLAKEMEPNTLIRHSTESDDHISDYNDLTRRSLQIPTKQKYGMYYTFCIIKALCELQRNQNYNLYTDIALHEFFVTFRVEYDYALKRKSWNPVSPYKF